MLVGTVFVACVDTNTPTRTGAIGIGALLPLTGELAASGIDLERSLVMAADAINRAGGIAGTPVAIVSADSNQLFIDPEDYETNAAIAVDWATRNELRVVFGPQIPELGARLAASFRREEILHVAGSVSLPSTIEATLRCSFDFFPSFSALGYQLAERLFDDGARTAGMIYLLDDYGTQLKERIQFRFEDLGGEIVDTSPTILGRIVVLVG